MSAAILVASAMTQGEVRQIAERCGSLPGLLGHGVAILAALDNEEDAQGELLEAWAAAQGIATYAFSVGRPADSELAQAIAASIAAYAVDQTMPRGA